MTNSDYHTKILLEKLLGTKNNLDGISKLSNNDLIIYGAGNYGRIIYQLLIRNGINSDRILGFMDINASEGMFLHSLPVLKPDSLKVPSIWKSNAQVIISIYNSLFEHKEIKTTLEQQGFTLISSCYEIAISFFSANNAETLIKKSEFFSDNRKKIIDGYSLWADERSLQTYENHFIGYAQCSIDPFLFETDHKQYFAPFMLRRKRYARFIDCGSFDGDTIRELNRKVGKIEALALFEPCEDNLEKLRKYISSEKNKIADQILLFPKGVWETDCELNFDDESGSASTLSDHGSSTIHAVAIDDALPDFAPTFIKMDIEGAEPQALKGAEKTIRNHKPDLAISVYHSLAHFWEIPQLLKNWVPEYQFYLRTYAAAGFETVLYAIAPE